MNRVRRTSRKYAELHNRPDHIARVTARKERAKAVQRRRAAQEMVASNPAPPKPKPDTVVKDKRGRRFNLFHKLSARRHQGR
jgi:hypothetical protein